MSSTPTDQPQYIPLSSSQIPFYTGQRLHPDAPIYNMPFAFDIKGQIDVEVFQLAFQKLIDRTDILRTVFKEVDGTPYQYVLESYKYHLKSYDFTDYDDQSMSDWIEHESKKILQIDKPLFEAGIIKRNDNHYIWYLNQHHLITDAWACTVLFRNCIEIYRTLLKGESVDTSPFPSYKNFVDNSHAEHTDQGDKVAEYWNEKYKQLPESLRFYGNRKNASTTLSNRIQINLGESRSQ